MWVLGFWFWLICSVCFYLEIWGNPKPNTVNCCPHPRIDRSVLDIVCWLPGMTKEHFSHLCAPSPLLLQSATIFSSFVTSNTYILFCHQCLLSPFFIRKGYQHPYFFPPPNPPVPETYAFTFSRLRTLNLELENRMGVVSFLVIAWF